jgi:hypothetical protein
MVAQYNEQNAQFYAEYIRVQRIRCRRAEGAEPSSAAARDGRYGF